MREGRKKLGLYLEVIELAGSVVVGVVLCFGD